MSQHSTSPRSEPASVLIVEDEEPIALALSFIVEDAGYVPTVAGHGAEALEWARTHQPALIITDLMMPRMTGREFIARLRSEAQEAFHRTPIVLMTAAHSAHTEDIDADAILLKPFEVTTVEELLKRFLE